MRGSALSLRCSLVSGRAAAEVGAVIIVGGNIERLHPHHDDGDCARDFEGRSPARVGLSVVLVSVMSSGQRACLVGPAGGCTAGGMTMRAPSSDLPITFHDASIRAGTVMILDSVTLSLNAGAPTMLIGPNGSGKTTLLRAAMGLVVPTSGRITWGGREFAPPTRRAIVFQHPTMLRRSAAANIRYAMKAARIPRNNHEARIAELLDLVGLKGFADRPARRMSGGEQQRLALARALGMRPGCAFSG